MSNRSSGDYRKNQQQGDGIYKDPIDDLLGNELLEAIRHMVENISKSFIVEWYTSISPTNHDFVASCETLIEDALTKLAELCVKRLDKYKVGQLVTSLLHDHILNDSVDEKIQSIESQIDNHEYDICQSSVVRLFGLLCTDELRRVIFAQDLNSPVHSNIPSYKYCSPRTSHQQLNQDDFYCKEQSNSEEATRTTSALYTLVIAMLTKAVFMPIVDSISAPNWLYAVIIWLCKKEERDRAKRDEASESEGSSRNNTNNLGRHFDHSSAKINAAHHATSIYVTSTRGCRSLDLEEGIDIVSTNINFENPVCDSLKRPLDNIEIYATEEVKSSSSNYILYCIGYDGLCHRHPSAGQFNFIPEHSELPIIDKRATHSSSKRMISSESSFSPVTNYTSRNTFRRRMTIKRRFREFVILQLRLEENPKIRPYMKNIPKPTKLKAATQSIFSLPGITNIKLDQSTIRLRQRFLERFLIALNSSPFIANSYELKEFFSYNVNSAINISKSKSLILQVNLNKVFVDSVRSALSMIRSTLPGDEYNLGSNPDPDAWMIELQQSTMKLHVQTRTSHSKMNLERYIDSKLISMNHNQARYDKALGSSSRQNSIGYGRLRDCYQGNSLHPTLVKSHSTGSNTNSSSLLLSKSSSSNSRNFDSSSRSSSTESVYYDASSNLETQQQQLKNYNSIQICDTVPIASKFIDIAHYSISKDPACSNSSINFMARLILGKTIESYAVKLLEAAFTLKNATFCINGITSSIWDESDDPPLDMEHANLDEAVLQLTKLLERNYVNYSFFPKQFLNTLISKQIRFFLSQLASQKRNKFVIYSFFVHLLDELETVDQ